MTLFHFSLCAQHIESTRISSAVLDQERNIWIYTPWQYEEYPDKKLEVIYVFDAQAREYFDLVHAITQFESGQEFAFIVVGIESPFNREKNQSRNNDFLPKATNQETIKKYGNFSGGADNFLNFIKTELVPYIDKQYRTLPEKIAIGHSNGATFISYSLIKEPDIFDAYIAISPNYAYDDGQLVKKFTKLSPKDIKTEKMVFISNSNENTRTADRWAGWSEANQKVIKLLSDKKFTSKIHLSTKDFSVTENHSTTVPVGVFYGIKAYIDYQFRTGKNIIKYYEDLANNNLITLDPEMVNTFAYECFWNQKTDDALIVINWAINKFPKAHNLYDSQGEFYEKNEEISKANTSFQKAMDILLSSKNEMDKNEFNEKMEYYKNNLQRTKKATTNKF
ncbi:hypothetical protein GCM10022393_31320 [Aquimarina addita]|uniref:Alpha/beta hydrolase n=1 Tax=Aquimarina addita TaxID=870485 RepID=A0ABP6UPG4_9FLAO